MNNNIDYLFKTATMASKNKIYDKNVRYYESDKQARQAIETKMVKGACVKTIYSYKV